jgi:hypothetical protein
MTRTSIRTGAQWIGASAAVAAGAYAAYAAATWLRYGRRVSEPAPGEADELLDRFMPEYEVVERHHISVAAPAAMTMSVAKNLDVTRRALARGLFKARAWALSGTGQTRELPHPLVEQMQAIGWRVLAEVPGEIVFGAVTKPWEADPEFRGMPASEFLAFHEPGYVKIAWTLRADAISSGASMFRTETRVRTTSAEARSKFRRYWAFASPGVALLRRLMLAPIKREAERRAAEAREQRPGQVLRGMA